MRNSLYMYTHYVHVHTKIHLIMYTINLIDKHTGPTVGTQNRHAHARRHTTHTHIHTYMHTCTRTHAHTHAHTHTHAHAHTCTHAHTHAHTHTHTHTHVCSHVSRCISQPDKLFHWAYTSIMPGGWDQSRLQLCQGFPHASAAPT